MSQFVKICSILNIDKNNSNIHASELCNVNDCHSFIVSDSDEELLILIEFATMVKLETITFYASTNDIELDEKNDINHNDADNEVYNMSAPKMISIYKTDHININFNDILDNKVNKPLRNVTLLQNKLNKGQKIKLNKSSKCATKLQKVKYLVIYIKTNQENTEHTYINGITFNEKNYAFDIIDASNMKKLKAFTAQLNKIKPTDANDQYFHITSDINQNQCTLNECSTVSRVCTILKRYQLQQNENNQPQKKDVYDDNYNNTNFLNDFNHLLLKHSTEFESIYDILIERNNGNNICNLSECSIVRRNHRDRSVFSTNETALKRLYSSIDDHEIITQQLIDRVHCHFLHTFDIGYKISISDTKYMQQQEIKTNEDDCNIDVVKIQDLLKSKRSNYQNIKDLERLKNCNKFT
eukprot:343924_1